MVKNVVKTRTSKKHKWSPENRSKYQDGGSSRKKKTNREETQCGQPESGWLKYVVIQNRNRVVKTCGRKAFESREANSHLKGFSSAGVVL